VAIRASSVLITCLLATACWYPARAHAGQADDLEGEEAPLGEEEMVALSPTTLKFATLRDMPSCVKVAPLRGDYHKGIWVGLFKMSAGCRVPWHWYKSTEQVMMVSGSGVFEIKDAKPLRFGPGGGAYVAVPGHHVHRVSCTTACTQFVTFEHYDLHYVDDTGKEIPPDEALKKPAARKSRKK
jgi:quercetin dioxygenase-like cupin family protein